MKIVAISDVHVKSPHDEADQLLLEFLRHPEVRSADYIMLLGDIFDLMCGPHTNYLKKYHHLFSELKMLAQSGRKIYYFEGNHDLHLEGLFKKFFNDGEVIVTQQPLIKEIDGKTYYFSHGDEHEVDNLSYQRYKRIIFSAPLRFFANYIMPLSVLDFIGERASKISRKKGYKQFDAEKVRDRFRSGVLSTTQGKYDFVLGGHSHVQDHFIAAGTTQSYINNGFYLGTRTFILIQDHHVSFQKLG